MSYVDKTLMQGESVVYRARLHASSLLPQLISLTFAVLWLAVCIFGDELFAAIFSDDPFGTNTSSVRWVQWMFGVGMAVWVIGALFALLGAIIRVLTSEFAVTNQRVVAKTGALRRQTTELLLRKIESAQVNQSILGRMLNHGTVVLSGTGSTLEAFRSIADPLEYRRQVQQQILSET